jgi:hypothetical protein
MQLFVAAMMDSLSEEVAAKDREIASLREHVTELTATRGAVPATGKAVASFEASAVVC